MTDHELVITNVGIIAPQDTFVSAVEIDNPNLELVTEKEPKKTKEGKEQ